MATIVSRNVTVGVIGPDGATGDALARFDATTGKLIQSSGVILDDADNLSQINELTINNGANDPMPIFNTLANSITTGIFGVGGLLTVNDGDTTEFDISDGVGYTVDNFTDPALPVPVRVTWSGLIGIAAEFVATNDLSFIALDSAGDVVQSDVPFNKSQRTTLLVLGTLVHATGVITSTGDQSVEFNSSKLGDDTATALGLLNTFGNNFNPASTDLTIRKEGGETFAPNTNRKNSGTNPNFSNDSVVDPVTFSYVFDDGAGGITTVPTQTDIDPNNFDDGTGVLQTVSNNQWTNHLCYFFPSSGEVIVRYGTEEFQNLADARAAAFEVPATIGFGLNPENVRTIISVEEGTLDLTNIISVALSDTGRFGLGSGGGTSGGGVFQSRQDTYNNSVDGIVLTDATRGPLGAQVGSGSDEDNVFALKNIAGTDICNVDGEGNLGISGDIVVVGTSLLLQAVLVTDDVTVNNLITAGDVDGRDVSVDGTKLDGIDPGANVNQTDAVIKTQYEANANTNAFEDAEKTKLTGIAEGAQVNQTDAVIKTQYEANADTNNFNDAASGKLAGIATGAQVNPDIVSQAEAEAGIATTERVWSAERVNQSIQALAPGGEASGSLASANIPFNVGNVETTLSLPIVTVNAVYYVACGGSISGASAPTPIEGHIVNGVMILASPRTTGNSTVGAQHLSVVGSDVVYSTNSGDAWISAAMYLTRIS